MAQVTIYLDDETEQLMRKAAQASGLSQSKWILNAIRAKAGEQWPQAVVELAGAWEDFPSVRELRASYGSDAPREDI